MSRAVALIVAFVFIVWLGALYLWPDMSSRSVSEFRSPYLGWVPLVFVVSFLLLDARRALAISLSFYAISCAIVLRYGIPRLGEAGVQKAELAGLMQQFVLGHAIYIALLSIIPWLGERYRHARSELADLREHQSVLNRLAVIFRTSPDALAITDSRGVVTDWNPAAEKLFGYNAEEIVGCEIARLRPPGEEELSEAMVASLWRGESVHRDEAERLAKDGSPRLVQMTVAPFPAEERGRAGTVVFYRDITEERTLFRRLAQSERLFRHAFDDAPIGMALVSLEGRWLDVNQVICKLMGYSRDELLRMDFQTITHPKDLDADLELLRETIAGQRPGYRMEKRYIHRSGSIVWILLAVSLVRDSDGEPQYFVSQLEDITEAKQARAELERSNTELEQFAYVVSHDLREPMRGIAGFSELLEKRAGDQLDDNARDYVHLIRESAERADRLIVDLLEYSRVGRGGAEPDGVDVAAVIREILADLRLQMEDGEAAIEFGELPPVRAHESDVRRLFQNLIANALKFARPGVPPRVHITGERIGDQVDFRVADNGIGIETKHTEDIFKVFQRLHGRDVEGTGIGLAVCRKAVETYGGCIRVESEPGAGSTFRFTLPAAEARPAATSEDQ